MVVTIFYQFAVWDSPYKRNFLGRMIIFSPCLRKLKFKSWTRSFLLYTIDYQIFKMIIFQI